LLGGRTDNLFGAWSIADVDLAMMLQRLIVLGDPVPQAAFGMKLVVIYSVVKYFGFQFNEERSIEIIILGELKILARESLDRVDVFPKREHLDVRNVAFHAAKTESAAIPRY
jgi:hypothetical protein